MRTELTPTNGGRDRHRSDAGVTFVEILVAIVLTGTVVIGVLTALRATAIATVTDRDHARAFEWLQAGADAVYNAPRIPCYDTSLDPIATYNAAVQAVAAPGEWVAASATIEVVDVQYIGRASSSDDYSWGSGFCLETDPVACPGGLYCESPQTAQKVSLVVTSPEGLVKSLETVKGD